MVLEFTLLPPEVNSGLMFGGAGAGPLFAAASAWAELASELSTSASSFESVISGLTGGQWTGPSAEMMAQAAAPYLQWLSAAVGHAEGSAAQAHAAAAAFEAAFAATVHPAAVTANRMTLMTLIATNILGQNTAAIFATEIEYMEMWAQDVAAMFGYHAGASSVAAALPTIIAPPGSLAGLVTTPLTDFLSSIGSTLASGLSSFVGTAESAIAQVGTLFSALPASVSSLASVAQIGMYPAVSAVVPPMVVLAHGAAPASSVVGATAMLADAPALAGATAPSMPVLGSSGGFGSAMSAGLGTARFVGTISVPPAWQGSIPARLVTAAMTGLEATAPAVPVGTGGPAGVPVMSSQSSSVARPGTPGAIPGSSGGPRAKHVVQSRPRVVPRTEVG
ncbi:MAG TPA: PPE family protein [Mycobacterium sp.]